jgi:hypothetical protein
MSRVAILGTGPGPYMAVADDMEVSFLQNIFYRGKMRHSRSLRKKGPANKD